MKIEPSVEFKISMKLLYRIMKVISDKNSIGKTALSQEANIHYTRLVKHLNWLERKGLAKFVVEDGKVNIALSESGRNLVIAFSTVSGENIFL